MQVRNWCLLTGVLGHRDDLSEQLSEVRQILTEEVSLDNNGLPGVGRSQLTTKKLRLASDAKGGSSLSVLHRAGKLAQVPGFVFDAIVFLTLKANSARPAVRPGRGWYRVPALATTASLVVGP